MPFVSQAQRAYMYANHPAIAKEFESHTPKGAKLPYHAAMDKVAKKRKDKKRKK